MSSWNASSHWGTDWFAADPREPALLHAVEHGRFAHTAMGLLSSLLMPDTDMDNEPYISLNNALRTDPGDAWNPDDAGLRTVLALFVTTLIRRIAEGASTSMADDGITMHVADCLTRFRTDGDGTVWVPWIGDGVEKSGPAIGARWVDDVSSPHMELSAQTTDGIRLQPDVIRPGDAASFLTGLGDFMRRITDRVIALHARSQA